MWGYDDDLYVNTGPDFVSEEDRRALETFGFFPEDEDGMFAPFRFGFC